MHEHRNQYATVKTIRKLVEVFAVLKEQGPMTLTQLVDTGVVSEQTIYAYKRKGYLAYKGGDNPSEASLLVPGIMPRTGRLDIDANVGLDVSVDAGDKNTTDMPPVGIASTLEILELLTKIEKHTRKIATATKASSAVGSNTNKKRDNVTVPITSNSGSNTADTADTNTIAVGSNIRRVVSTWLKAQRITWKDVEKITDEAFGSANDYTKLAILISMHYRIIDRLPKIIQEIEKGTKRT